MRREPGCAKRRPPPCWPRSGGRPGVVRLSAPAEPCGSTSVRAAPLGAARAAASPRCPARRGPQPRRGGWAAPPAVGGSPAAAGGTSARGRRPPASSGGRPRPTPSSRAVLGLGPGFASLLSEADGRWRASWSEAPRSWLRFPLLTRHHRCRPEHGRLLTSFCNHKG